MYSISTLSKTQFKMPAQDFVTKGKNLTWQTPNLEASVMLDDTGEHQLMKIVVCKTEKGAEGAIRKAFNMATLPVG